MPTRTKIIDFQQLELGGEDANVVVRLMMACNDMALANQALEISMSENHPYPDKRTSRAAGMYFVRIQLSHLYEALKVIDDLRARPVLKRLVDSSDFRTKGSFAHLEQHLPGGKRREWFEKLIAQLRHNLGFHYHESGSWIQWAINDRAERPGARYSSITRGDHAYRWRFSVADAVIDSIVCRKIWEIPREKDLEHEIGLITGEINVLFLSYVDFCGEFIWQYCSR